MSLPAFGVGRAGFGCRSLGIVLAVRPKESRRAGKNTRCPPTTPEAYLAAYVEAAGLADDKKGPLLRAALGRTKQLARNAMTSKDAWRMVQRRANSAVCLLPTKSQARFATLTPSGWIPSRRFQGTEAGY